MLKAKVILFFCALSLLVSQGHADEEKVEAEKPAAEAEKVESSEGTWEDTLINSNRAVSEWFDGFVEGVDLFLVGKRITDRANESSIRIENSTFWGESQSLNNVSSFSFNPRLVNLEEFLHLKFTTYDEQTESRGVQNRYLRQNPRERNYGATIGLFRRLGNIRTAFQPRIELQDPLKVSHSLSFESVAEVKNRYRINPKLELYANASSGVGTFQSLNFNFQLDPIYSLTFFNEGDYQEKPHLYVVTNGVSVGQSITEKSSLAYTFLFNSTNKPKYHLDNYSLSVAWSEIIYDGIIDYSIVPHLDFPFINHFKGSVGITFTFNLNFN